MLHRASVLCLAARLMLLDQAADDLLIQVQSLSSSSYMTMFVSLPYIHMLS
jgi:hypothetical protein